jgi:ATP/maltotriose-dependent transcriptional regulator MalT
VGLDQLLADGGLALGEGRWRDARSAFEEALEYGPAPQALDGLGEVMWWLGDPHRSNELREQAYAGFRRAGESERAVIAALGVAITYESNFGNNQAAAGWVARASRLLSGDDDPLAPWVLATRAYVTSEPPAAIALYERALAAARATGDIDLELSSLSGLGERLVMAGEVAAGMAMIDEAMAGTLGGEYTRLDTVVFTSCDMLIACDLAHDHERAARWCQVADRFIQNYGCPFLSARCRTIYGGLLVTSGRWAEAEDELATAITMSAGAGPNVAADAFARMAELRLRQGRIEEAAALLTDYEEQDRAQLAAASLRLARGDTAGAVALLRRRIAGAAHGHIGSAPALALLVRATLLHGDVDAASVAAETLVRLATGRRSAYTDALAAFSAGQVRLARNDIDEGRSRLDNALQIFATLGMPHEGARVRLEVARALTALQPDVATAEAEAAFVTFDRIGARPDADAAAALLRSLGAPVAVRRRVGELTDRERQVLQLVALGLSNPEIAARLHISRKTAAHHVSNVLTKLGVRNRTEAAAHLPAQKRAHT